MKIKGMKIDTTRIRELREHGSRGAWMTAEHVKQPRALVALENKHLSLLGLDTDGQAIIFRKQDADLAAEAVNLFVPMADEIDRLRAQPRVGVALILRNKLGQVLLHKRKGAHGAGTWSLPGGHMEPGEQGPDTAIRELHEETGIDLRPLSPKLFLVGVTNTVFHEIRAQYITLIFEILPGFALKMDDDMEARIMEPDKCEEWRWCDLEPGPLFKPLQQLVDAGHMLFTPVKGEQGE